MKSALFALALTILTAPVLWAQDVVVMGEIHDNPFHHAEQAARVTALDPAAIVFEMLTEDQAAAVTPLLRDDAAALEAALGWTASGWPDFAMYYPIFAASAARIYGAAVPRENARRAMEAGIAGAFPGDAPLYGLDRPLPADEQAMREALQMAAHCDALPPEMLPPMVEVQRLRDAMLARAVMQAMADTGGPVAVITGNGHARRDWGVPSYLSRLDPALKVHVLGQTEDGAALDGGFDEVLSHPAIDRPDPCAAFR